MNAKTIENLNIDSLIDHSRNAPRRPSDEIQRENIITAIERCFQSTGKVFLAGDALSGKSIIASQFMRKHENKALGVFFSHGTHIFYSSHFMRLSLKEQIEVITNGKRSSEVDDCDIEESVFNRYILRLQPYGRKEALTFVIDGLTEQEKDFYITKEIFSNLPASQTEFRFLMTGSDELYEKLGLHQSGWAKVPFINLSQPEICSYFKDTDLTDSDLRALQSYSGGNIGILNKLKQFIQEGSSIDDILNDKTGKLSDVFEYEWKKIKVDDFLLRVFSVIAYSKTFLSTKDIAELLDSSVELVEGVLSNCRIAELNEEGRGWTVRSVAQRKFLERKVEKFKKETESLLIERLMRKRDDYDSMISLPSQLISAGRHMETLAVLNKDHFSSLLEKKKFTADIEKPCQIWCLFCKRRE